MPAMIEGATRFSTEPAELTSPTTLVRYVSGMPRVMAALNQTLRDHNHGPQRSAGHWALVLLGFVVSREPGIQPWYRRMALDEEFWRACGFDRVPAYQTVWQRLTEMEDCDELFQLASNALIRQARAKDPRVGMWLEIDGTECETHAQQQHACGPEDDCPTRGQHRQPRLKRMTVTDARASRQHESVVEETELDIPKVIQDVPQPLGPNGLRPVPANGTTEYLDDGRVRTASGGHWWATRDHDAGTRLYRTTGKVWFGFMNIKAVDIFTGAVIAVHIAPANRCEHHSLPDVYERVRGAVGTDPIAVVADKGYATDAVYRHLKHRDVTPVIPFRQRHGSDPRHAVATNELDRHGVPRCKHCGEPGNFVSTSGGAQGRVWFKCSLPSTPDCVRTQTIAHEHDVRRLLPIWRTSKVYGALRSQFGSHERLHETWRANFRSGGNNLRDRLRRPGLPWQQLHANAALVAQWVWVLIKLGWAGRRTVENVVRDLVPGNYHRVVGRARWRNHIIGGSYPEPTSLPPPG